MYYLNIVCVDLIGFCQNGVWFYRNVIDVKLEEIGLGFDFII